MLTPLPDRDDVLGELEIKIPAVDEWRQSPKAPQLGEMWTTYCYGEGLHMPLLIRLRKVPDIGYRKPGRKDTDVGSYRVVTTVLSPDSRLLADFPLDYEVDWTGLRGKVGMYSGVVMPVSTLTTSDPTHYPYGDESGSAFPWIPGKCVKMLICRGIQVSEISPE